MNSESHLLEMSYDAFDNNGLTHSRTKRAIVIIWGSAWFWYTNGYTEKGKDPLKKQQRFENKKVSEKCKTSIFIYSVVNGSNYYLLQLN